MNDIAKVEHAESSLLALPEEGPTPTEFLLRLATTIEEPEKLRAVMEIYAGAIERQRAWKREDDAAQAKREHFAAKAKMQADLPVLERDKPNQEGRGKYVDYGDLWERCCPIWTKHGFSVDFPDAFLTEAGLIRLTCRVSHAGGHSEIFTAPDAPPDMTGIRGAQNKTVPQGNQSTISLLSRGLVCRAIGIAMKREDDDGNSGARSLPPRRYEHNEPMLAEQARNGEFNRRAATPKEQPPPEPTWLNGAEAWLAEAVPKSIRWKTRLCKLISTAPEKGVDRATFEAFLALPTVAPFLVAEDFAADLRTEVQVATGQARAHYIRESKRLPFQANIVDERGEVIDGPFTGDRREYAEAFVAHLREVPAADWTARINANIDALSAANTDTEAAKILLKADIPVGR